MSPELLRSLKQLQEPCRSILTSLIAGEQCMFASEQLSGTELGDVLHSACLETFNLSPVLVDCKQVTSVESFHEHLLIHDTREWQEPSLDIAAGDHRASAVAMPKRSSLRQIEDYEGSGKKIASVVIATNLDLAIHEIQVQLIELLRRNRIFTTDAMYTGPKHFLLLVTLSRPTARLSYHLNDMIAISCLDYDHRPRQTNNDLASSPTISRADVTKLRAKAVETRLTAEIDAFLHDIVLFMRMSRYVQAGVTATATRHLRVICKAIAPMHGIAFVTPTIVILGSRQVYPHRIVLSTADSEKSLQWGSYPQAVREMLDDMDIPTVIDDVVASVETPL